jgi:peroxiredoxin
VVLLAGLMALATTACESEKSAKSGDEAKAVEANEKADKEKKEQAAKESDEKADDKQKEGAAAEKADDSAKEAPKQATVGEPAPGFTLTDAQGDKHSLADYKGEMVVLEWTSPECPYVQRHYKAGTSSTVLEKLGGADKVNWLAVDSSHFNTPKKSKAFKKKYGFDFPVLQDKDGSVGKKYGAKTTPHMYIIDKEGVLRYNGAIDDDPKGRKDSPTNYVKQAVEALKSGEKVEPSSTKPYGCSVKYKG